MNAKSGLLSAGLCLFAGAGFAADDAASWKPLFNGKSLNGWTAHYASKVAEGAAPPARLFDVENGVIHVYRDEAAGSEQPNAYLLSSGEHQNYKLSLEYRWGEKKFAPRLDLVRDAGLLYHVHRQRAVINALCSVTVFPLGRGHREQDALTKVRIDWHRSQLV